MQLWIQTYRTLDRHQHALWFRLAASVIAIAGSLGFFGYLVNTSYSIDAQRQPLLAALSNQNLTRGDEHAVSLKNTGTVFVNGHTYGGTRYLKPRTRLFDDAGNLVQVDMLVESFLYDLRPAWAPGWLLDEPAVSLLLGVMCTIWLLLIVWMPLTVQFAITLAGTSIPVMAAAWLERPQLELAFAGVGVLTFTFVLLNRVSQFLLNRPQQIPAVAHTVLKEASRRGIALVFIVLLLIILPMLPMMLNAESPLRYRIQTFISLSLGLTFTIAAVMTLFFSCASVAFEIRDRQIWQLMTKPLVRLNYLLGKWVGLVTLNLVILVVAGISTFTFIQYLRTLPVENTDAGQLDLLAVRDEVLTARLGGKPAYETLDPVQLRTRVNEIIENDPDLSKLEHVPLRTRLEIEQKLKTAFSVGQRSIPPNDVREYVFTNLQEARKISSTVTLRYKFYILTDDEHKTFEAGFIFNDDPNLRHKATFVPSISHSIPIPASLIRDDGTLKVSIVNLNATEPGKIGAINFEEDQFELLYKAGSFAGNFVRALLTIWIKLAFLAALGISCATFLNFPVACLLSFTVFFAGMLGPFLAQSLEWYYPMETQQVDWSNIGMVLQWMFESITRWVALAMVFLLSSFGEYRPTQSLVEGRLIEWSSVLYGLLNLAVLWSGLSLLLGYAVLRKRQLAIYSGIG